MKRFLPLLLFSASLCCMGLGQSAYAVKDYVESILDILQPINKAKNGNRLEERKTKDNRLHPLFWFRGDVLQGSEEGKAVGFWKDQSVNGHDAIRDEEWQRPVYKKSNDFDDSGFSFLEFKGGHSMRIINHARININDFYKEKTVVVVFRTSNNVESQQVIYEEGGCCRGLNISLHKGRLYFGAYNLVRDDLDSTPWGYIHLNVPIELNQFYVATLVYNYNVKSFDAYLNGRHLGSIEEIGILYRHPGEIGIGAAVDHTVLYNHKNYNNQDLFFNGGIYELLYYDAALNTSQNAVVQSYLSAKYDIDLYVR